MFAPPRRGRWARSRAPALATASTPPFAMKWVPSGAQRRGPCDRSTTTTTTTRSSLDATSLDDLKIVPQLLGFLDLIPAEELLHARGYLGNNRPGLIRKLVEQMQTPDQ